MSVNEVYFTLNLTGPAVTETVVSVALFDAEGSEFDASQIVFSAVARHVETRSTVQVGCSLGGRPNLLILSFPALLSGKWEYEVWGTFDDGTRSRFAAGIYTALSTVARFEEKKPEAGRSLTAIVGKDMQVLSAMCNASTVAEMAALRADRSADAADDAARRLDETQETVDALKRGIAQALSISPQGTLVIGTTDTGFVLKGVPGMNADDIAYHLISNVSQLPTDTEHCNVHHRYLVQGGAAVEASGWVEFVLSPAGAEDFLWLYINGFPVIVETPDGSLEQWADAINADSRYRVTATVDGSFLRLTAITPGSSGNNITLQALEPSGQPYMPTSGDTLTGGEDADLSEQYIWLDGRWTKFPLKSPLRATTLADGSVRLSTSDVVSDGLDIGCNAEGQIVADVRNLVLPAATTLKAGVVRKASAISASDTGVPTASQVYTFHNNQIQTMVQQAVEAAITARVQSMLESYMNKDAIQVVEELPAERADGVFYFVVRPQ